MKAPALLLCCSVLASCGKDPEPDREPVNLTAGVPVAGVAEVDIDFPIGSPMGGYSNRCDYLGRMCTRRCQMLTLTNSDNCTLCKHANATSNARDI